MKYYVYSENNTIDSEHQYELLRNTPYILGRNNWIPRRVNKNMKNFRMNLDLKDSLDYTVNTESEDLPKEIQDKIKLIKNAFK
jgi:hypothetical protein